MRGAGGGRSYKHFNENVKKNESTVFLDFRAAIKTRYYKIFRLNNNKKTRYEFLLKEITTIVLRIKSVPL